LKIYQRYAFLQRGFKSVQLLLILVTTFFTSVSARYGDDILAANALLMQLFTLFSYIMDGFAYASEALTGKYIGAKQTSYLNKLVKRLFLWGVILSLLFTITYLAMRGLIQTVVRILYYTIHL